MMDPSASTDERVQHELARLLQALTDDDQESVDMGGNPLIRVWRSYDIDNDRETIRIEVVYPSRAGNPRPTMHNLAQGWAAIFDRGDVRAALRMADENNVTIRTSTGEDGIERVYMTTVYNVA